MSKRSTEHAKFGAERTYAASPAQVFGAWADPAAKARWFIGPTEFTTEGHTLDFRVGGREGMRVIDPGGPSYAYDAIYRDIVAEQRIVYIYEMRSDGTLMSVSLVTIELWPADDGTRLIYTEQAAFLDGADNAENRIQGVHYLLDNLGKELQRGAAQ